VTGIIAGKENSCGEKETGYPENPIVRFDHR